LAQAGFEITGVDIAARMLERARLKAGDMHIRWVEADVRGLDLGKKFSFIFENGSVFMHMLTNPDQSAFLASARSHLAPGGRFVLGVLFPHPGYLATDLDEKEWFTYNDQRGQPVKVSGIDEYDEINQVKTETAIRRFTLPGGKDVVHRAPLSLRYTFPQEMEALLEREGFTVLERYGDFDRSPLAKDSQNMIYVCGLG
jgi:SAM-dependent methyltransferase